MGQARGCLVGALEEREYVPRGVGRPSRVVVAENELPERGVERGGLEVHASLPDAWWRRIMIGVEGRLAERLAGGAGVAGPESTGEVLLVFRDLIEARGAGRWIAGATGKADMAEIE